MIPAILDNLLDYENFQQRIAETNNIPTYIWVKKGRKEEAWAVCSLLGMIVDGDVEVDGYPVANTYIFARYNPSIANKLTNKADFYAIGVEGRFHLRDLEAYFDQWETNNAT